MTVQLQAAFERAARLPEALQDELARQIQAIEEDLKWDQTLAQSQPLLNKMVDELREERRLGTTVRKGWDEL